MVNFPVYYQVPAHYQVVISARSNAYDFQFVKITVTPEGLGGVEVEFSGRGEGASLAATFKPSGTQGTFTANGTVWTFSIGDKPQVIALTYEYALVDSSKSDFGQSGQHQEPKKVEKNDFQKYYLNDPSGTVTVTTEDEGKDDDKNDTVATIVYSKIPSNPQEVVDVLAAAATAADKTDIAERIRGSDFARSIGGLFG